jgi:pentose-5-phosphate-3-epimerase
MAIELHDAGEDLPVDGADIHPATHIRKSKRCGIIGDVEVVVIMSVQPHASLDRVRTRMIVREFWQHVESFDRLALADELDLVISNELHERQ